MKIYILFFENEVGMVSFDKQKLDNIADKGNIEHNKEFPRKHFRRPYDVEEYTLDEIPSYEL